MPIPSNLLEARLKRLYEDRAPEIIQQVCALIEKYRSPSAGSDRSSMLWNEHDIVLITYADQVRSSSSTALATLADWLQEEKLDSLLSVVHLLPFFPYSSDDGFSVRDFLAVDPEVGDWSDVARLGKRVDLMFDLVLNHISRVSEWFKAYLEGESQYENFFIETDPSLDYSQVVRPRSLPLLTAVETSRGTRHVWTTFSEDQIDLNYSNPEVLLKMLDILLKYAQQGARIIRLDAIAFLWKEIGTNCLHLPETHEVVKLMRDLLSETFPDTLVLTETNVPHEENISYFGNGDEAHLVYQFSLPPLILDAFINGDVVYFRQWLEDLSSPPENCTYFNFTASHDGIGVRPLEGLVPEVRVNRIVEAVRERGGFVNTRRRSNGTDIPYELNITYLDALSPTTQEEAPQSELHVRRFLTSQALMLALPGIPAVYFHSLVGTQNDLAGVEETGINRRINRHKYNLEELSQHLADKDSLAAKIYQGYRKLLVARQIPAFHPNAPIKVLHGPPDSILAFTRTSCDGQQQVLVVVNFGHQNFTIQPHELMGASKNVQFTDLIHESSDRLCNILPGDFLWIATT